jgi:type VI secretion system protein VasI
MFKAYAIGAFALAIFAGPSTSALADIKSDIATCAVIVGDLDRLGCYDAIAKAQGLDGPQPAAVDTTGAGKWRISRDKNPIDDSERVVLMLAADEGASRFKAPVTFVARCQSKKTEAYIIWGEYLGNDGDIDEDYKVVTVRVGSKSAKQERWGTSTDSEATFAPDWAGDLLKEMAGANKLVVQVTPYDENPITAVFDTTGMKAALAPLMDVCGWTLDATVARPGGKP